MPIIISINTNINDASFDIEVPDDVVVSKITQDLVSCMEEQLKIQIDWKDVVLSSERLDLILDPNMTMAELGIWNGDYIYLTVL